MFDKLKNSSQTDKQKILGIVCGAVFVWAWFQFGFLPAILVSGLSAYFVYRYLLMENPTGKFTSPAPSENQHRIQSVRRLAQLMDLEFSEEPTQAIVDWYAGFRVFLNKKFRTAKNVISKEIDGGRIFGFDFQHEISSDRPDQEFVQRTKKFETVCAIYSAGVELPKTAPSDLTLLDQLANSYGSASSDISPGIGKFALERGLITEATFGWLNRNPDLTVESAGHWLIVYQEDRVFFDDDYRELLTISRVFFDLLRNQDKLADTKDMLASSV